MTDDASMQIIRAVDTKDLIEEIQADTMSCAPTVAVLTHTSSDDASTILDLSDYSPKTWGEIVSYGVPTVGIAVLALTHPILFLAGASISLLGVGGAYAIDATDCPSPWEVPGEGYADEKDKKNSSRPPNELSISTGTSSDDPEDDEVLLPSEPDEQTPPNPLKNTIVANAQFSGLHAIDFFQIFFGDDAPFSFKDFQKQRGDVNIRYSDWGAQVPQQRVLSFQTPTRHPFFGPSHATATKTQKLVMCSKSLVVMECTTKLQDIPFSNCFVVREQWILTSEAEKICNVNVSSQVNFVQSCPFESQINAKTTATLREALSAWKKMAQKAIVVTRNKQQDSEQLKLDDEIEVTYYKSKKSCVIGEEHDGDDWEMDPEVIVVRPSPPKRGGSLGAFRQSLTQKFLKRQ